MASILWKETIGHWRVLAAIKHTFQLKVAFIYLVSELPEQVGTCSF